MLRSRKFKVFEGFAACSCCCPAYLEFSNSKNPIPTCLLRRPAVRAEAVPRGRQLTLHEPAIVSSGFIKISSRGALLIEAPLQSEATKTLGLLGG